MSGTVLDAGEESWREGEAGVRVRAASPPPKGEKEESSESLEEETPDDKLDSEKREVTPDKKKSDNVQKSLFDTFDENQ